MGNTAFLLPHKFLPTSEAGLHCDLVELKDKLKSFNDLWATHFFVFPYWPKIDTLLSGLKPQVLYLLYFLLQDEKDP